MGGARGTAGPLSPRSRVRLRTAATEEVPHAAEGYRVLDHLLSPHPQRRHPRLTTACDSGSGRRWSTAGRLAMDVANFLDIGERTGGVYASGGAACEP